MFSLFNNTTDKYECDNFNYNTDINMLAFN